MAFTPAAIQQLLQRVAEGDRTAFAQLYDATHLKLFGIVIRILKRKELAEEILQEVYVRIWQRAGDFDGALASPITWMAVIARNRALDEVRRKGLDISDDQEAAARVPDLAPTPAENVERRESLNRLQGCLDALEPDRRDVIRRAYLDGFSRKELADMFGQPINTIKTWLHRGLKQLRVCLEQ